MIAYLTLGTADLDRATAFYDPIFAVLGHEPCWRTDKAACWGIPEQPQATRFFVCLPFDGAPASVGNGTMTALWAETTDQIAQCHRLALTLGGTCDGPPGPRPHYGDTFHAAYVRDPDGNKIAFVRF